jgi:hypothetical protein
MKKNMNIYHQRTFNDVSQPISPHQLVYSPMFQYSQVVALWFLSCNWFELVINLDGLPMGLMELINSKMLFMG